MAQHLLGSEHMSIANTTIPPSSPLALGQCDAIASGLSSVADGLASVHGLPAHLQETPDPAFLRSIERTISHPLGWQRAAFSQQSPPADRTAEASLLVFDGEQPDTVALPSLGTVLIGRDPSANVRFAQPTMSRHHARLQISPQEIILVDLDSRNGTFVNGERIAAPRSLLSRDVITIDQVTMILQWGGPKWQGTIRLDTSMLRSRLSEEVFRAQKQQREFVLLAFDFRDSHSFSQESVRSALTKLMSPIEFAAWGSSSRLFLLLPEVGRNEFLEARQPYLDALAEIQLVPRMGHVFFPGDACDPDSLISSAVSSALAAQPGECLAIDATSVQHAIGGHRILVADPAMRYLYDEIRQFATRDMTVLIQGETGTGKESIAQALHYWSKRHERPLICKSMAELCETLFDSHLFGHKKGSFSGAISDVKGLIELAESGTLFLDEINTLSAACQAKLLRFLQEKSYSRVGEPGVVRKANVRIVAATNVDLLAEVEAGRFRRDLYYRLGRPLCVSPLRERKREIPLLAREFLRRLCLEQKRPLLQLSDQAMAKLIQYGWPGNVRELQDLMTRLEAKYQEETEISLDQLQDALEPGTSRTEPDSIPSENVTESPSPSGPSALMQPLEKELNSLRKQRVIEALIASNGVIKQAAVRLGVPERTFHEYVRRFGIVAKHYAVPRPEI